MTLIPNTNELSRLAERMSGFGDEDRTNDKSTTEIWRGRNPLLKGAYRAT